MFEHFLKHGFHYHIYFLVGTICYSLHKIHFWKETFRAVYIDKFFFLPLWIVFAIIPLINSPFKPLVYFDEHNYLLSAQNIVEGGVNALCNLNEHGVCKVYAVGPHGLGVNPVYALFYDYQFDLFYRKVAFFNLALYLFNAALMFVLAMNLFMSRSIGMVTSILVLAMPYNIIYATNVMPETFSNTLLLIALYCLIRLHRGGGGNRNLTGSDKTSLQWTLFCVLLLICSIRIEYVMLLSVFLIWRCVSLKSTLDARPWTLRRILLMVWISGAILLAYAYAGYYLKNKVIGGAGAGWDHFNFSYFEHYCLNWSFVVLSVFFVVYWVSLAVGFIKSAAGAGDRLNIFLAGVFFVFIIFYSFYNFPAVYRFLIPISSLYILFSSAGLIFLARLFFKKEGKMFWTAGAAFLFCLVVPFVRDSLQWKHEMVSTDKNSEFIKILDRSSLEKISPKYGGESCYFFLAPYLGQVSRIENYSDNYDWAVQKLKEGKNLFYLENAFQRVGRSPFRDTRKFVRVLENEGSAPYRIYKIDLLDKEINTR